MNARAILVAALFALVVPSWAGEGHSHGEAEAPANGNGPQRLPDGSVFLPKPAQHQLSVRTSEIRRPQTSHSPAPMLWSTRSLPMWRRAT